MGKDNTSTIIKHSYRTDLSFFHYKSVKIYKGRYVLLTIWGNIMQKEAFKKIFVFLVTIAFLGMCYVPAINADMSKADEEATYDLLIITPKEFVKELRPLVYHKNSVGVKTRLVTLDKVYEEMFWHGRDNAEKVKYFIKSALDEWGIKYVMLVGGMKGQTGKWYLPVRYVDMDNDWEPHYLSDLYFADIYDSEGNFSSWDSDGDGKYGEWYNKEDPEDKYIDMKPDICIGRLPCRNTFEVKIMVNKIIHYEETTFNKSWFKDMTVIAGDTYPEFINPNWTGYEGEYYADQALGYMNGFNENKLYTSDGSLTGPRDIIRAVSKGCGFLYFVGHGSPMVWTNHLPNSEERLDPFKLTHIMQLRNKDKLPIAVVSGCHNLQFDVNLMNFIKEGYKRALFYGEGAFESFGWLITRKIGGGSIATLGCTALGHTKEDKLAFEGGVNELEVEFFRQYGVENKEILGDAWNSAIKWYVDTYPVNWDNTSEDAWIDIQVPQSWSLFGDPSLKIGGYQPTITIK